MELPFRKNWPLRIGVVVVILALLAGIGWITFSWTLNTVLASPPCSPPAKELGARLAASPALQHLPTDATEVSRYVRCGDSSGDTPGDAVFTGVSFHTGASRTALVSLLESASDLGEWRRGLNGSLDGTSPRDVKNVAFVETRVAGHAGCVSLYQDSPHDFRLELSASTVGDVHCPAGR